MRFSKERPVKIILLGAGGTGGHIAPHLYRLLYSLGRPVRLILCDGDLVEANNLIRQNFIEADLGVNKARVLAERYASVFGLETEYIPSFVETEEALHRLTSSQEAGQLVILIGAVDNNKSRKLCHTVFYQSKELIYIDSGNGEFSGQVVCGVRRNNRTYAKPVGVIFPDILEDTDKFPSERSCAEAAVSAPQSIVANLMAATTVLNMVYNILVTGNLDVKMVTFSTKSMMVRPTLLQRRRTS